MRVVFFFFFFAWINLTPHKPTVLLQFLKKRKEMQKHTLFPSRLSWTTGWGRIPWLCSLSITYSAGAPVEHLSLLACVNQKPCSGEGKVESWNSYLSPTQLPKKTELWRDRQREMEELYTLDGVCMGTVHPRTAKWRYGWTLTVTSAYSLPPPFILFIKGTFHRISLLSFCPSPAAIHFNSALVKASWSRNRE